MSQVEVQSIICWCGLPPCEWNLVSKVKLKIFKVELQDRVQYFSRLKN